MFSIHDQQYIHLKKYHILSIVRILQWWIYESVISILNNTHSKRFNVFFVSVKLKLVSDNNNNSSSGRLQTFIKGEWIEVCTSQWTQNEAKVACRELGFSGYDFVSIKCCQWRTVYLRNSSVLCSTGHSTKEPLFKQNRFFVKCYKANER